MKIAFHTSSLGERDLESALRETGDLGYEYVELAADVSLTPHFAAHAADAAAIRRVGSLLRRHELQLAAIDIGGWDAALCLANLDDSQRAAAVDNVSHVVDVAGELGCGLVTSHLWGLPAEGLRDADSKYVEALRTSISELCRPLEDTGVRLDFMPHPGGLREKSDPAVDLIRSTGCPNIGYTYGMGHAFVMQGPGQDDRHMIEYAGETLTHVLVSDTHAAWRIIAPPNVGAHEHTALGAGDVDVPEVLGALRAIGYDGYLSVHVISETDRIVRAAKETKRRLEEHLN